MKVYSRRRSWEIPEGAVYVGRPTLFGNPFVVGVHGQQGACVELYRTWLMKPEQAQLRGLVERQLRGKSLVCWCAPLACHVDVLMELANR